MSDRVVARRAATSVPRDSALRHASFPHRAILLSWVVFCMAAAGCATTRLSQVETVAPADLAPFSRLLVLGPPAMAARAEFEAALAAGLEAASGGEALAGSPRLPADTPITPEVLTGAAERVGADGVLTVVPAQFTVIHHRPPLAPYYPYGFHAWPGFYPFHDPFYQPLPVMRFRVLRLELRLYAVGGRRPVWRAFSETIDPTAALAGELGTRVAADLARRGLLVAPVEDEPVAAW